MKIECSDEIHQKLLNILDRLEQPIDTRLDGELELHQYYFKFDTKQNMETVEN